MQSIEEGWRAMEVGRRKQVWNEQPLYKLGQGANGKKPSGLFFGAAEERIKEEEVDVTKETTPKEFLENTTIHGLGYFVRDDWGLFERCIWGIIVAGSFITALSFILNSLREAPTITTIRASTLPVQQTQFPTLTVCPSDFADEDHLGFLRRYVNHWKFDCFDGDCEDSEPARDLTKFWLDEIFEKKFQDLLEGYYDGKRYGCYHSHEIGQVCMSSFRMTLDAIMRLPGNDLFKETVVGMRNVIRNNIGKYKTNEFIEHVLSPYLTTQYLKGSSAEVNTTGWHFEYNQLPPHPEHWGGLVLSLYSPWETICTLKHNMEQCLCNMNRGLGTYLTFTHRDPVYAQVDLENYASKGQRGEHKLPDHIESSCVTSNATDPPHQPCLFPFYVNDLPVYQCQKFRGESTESWCATSVDEHRRPITTGPCDPDICQPCMTIGGNVPSTECRLPFLFKGDTFWMCTRRAYHRPWCSTSVVRENFQHSGGYWGACNPDCPSTSNPGFFEDNSPEHIDVSVSQGLQRLNKHLREVYSCITQDPNNTLSLLDATLLLTKNLPESRWDWFYAIDGELKEDGFGFWLKSPGVALDPVCNTTHYLHLGKQWFQHYISRFTKAEVKAPNPCTPTQPNQQLSPCCGYYGKKLARGLKTIMGMMRSIKPQGRRTEKESEFIKRFKVDQCESLPRNEGFEGGTFEEYQRLMIPGCYFVQGINMRNENLTTDKNGFAVAERCGAFEPVLSSKGLCYTYNSRSVAELYTETSHRDAFMEAYDAANESNVVNVSSHGPDFLLKMVLDASSVGNDSRVAHINRFLLSLNNDHNPFNVANNAIEIEVGYTTKLSIVPFQQVATDDLRELDLNERKCRFKDENETMTIFKHYTLAGCQMECMMNFAQLECGCRPWDLPHPPGEVEEICDFYGQICFTQQMKDVEQLRHCDCLENCEITTYTYTMSREPIVAKKDINCFRGDNSDLSRTIMFRSTSQRLTDYYTGLASTGVSRHDEDKFCNYCECARRKECQTFVEKNIALLEIQIATPTLIQTELAKRTSLANQIGVLGGNLGLFTGISVISLFEMLFWMRRMLFNRMRSLRGNFGNTRSSSILRRPQ